MTSVTINKRAVLTIFIFEIFKTNIIFFYFSEQANQDIITHPFDYRQMLALSD